LEAVHIPLRSIDKAGNISSTTDNTFSKYTVTFDSQSADTAASPTSKVILSGAALGTLPTKPVKNGYTFGGWWTQPNGGGTQIAAYTTITGNSTAFAKWNAGSSSSPSPTISSSSTNLKLTAGSNTLYVGGRTILTPSIKGGTWQYDKSFVELTKNADGTATVKALKAGVSNIYYTVGWASAEVTLTLKTRSMPQTGQDFTWMYVFLTLAGIACAGTLILVYRKKKARTNK
jgi:uncharacterized repeat protein (TIGR02543 family)/LPXTG-motif cell wall-anchored protein